MMQVCLIRGKGAIKIFEIYDYGMSELISELTGKSEAYFAVKSREIATRSLRSLDTPAVARLWRGTAQTRS